MRCIYCLESSDDAKGLAHVIPEGIAANDLTLPRGAVCDSCNTYLGHELDAVMIAHPVLALIIQFLRLPGKDGSVRKRLGNVASDVHPNAITIPCEMPRRVQGSDGRWESVVEPLVDPRFDFRRFRRALHHVAFNALTLRDGMERALENMYDPVRRYIRQPLQNESWAFVQYVNLHSGWREM
jgi:HNH endonuclease